MIRVSHPALAAAVCALILSGCASPRFGSGDSAPKAPPDLSGVQEPVPRAEPPSRYGNPPSYQVAGREYRVLNDISDFHQRGIASWYGTKFHGKRTSSGEVYNMYAMTAAHKRLPLPTYVRVTNLDNGKSVVVRVNDRGPFVKNRIIDLSYAAAAKLDMLGTGTAPVEIDAIDPSAPEAADKKPPAAEPAAPGKVRYYVQAGAFRDRENAQRLKSELDRLASVEIQAGVLGANSIYRVRLGPVQTVDAVDRLSEQLKKRGVSDPQVVVDQ